VTDHRPVPPTLSARALNRATLGRQLLLHRARLDVLEAMRRIVAVQAQHPASPYVALWNRIDEFDPAALDRAFARHEIVKGTSIRMTLHAVLAEDHPPFHEAMQPSLRESRLSDSRFRVAGLTPADVDALIPEVLEYASEPRSNADMEAWFDRRLGVLERPGAVSVEELADADPDGRGLGVTGARQPLSIQDRREGAHRVAVRLKSPMIPSACR